MAVGTARSGKACRTEGQGRKNKTEKQVKKRDTREIREETRQNQGRDRS